MSVAAKALDRINAAAKEGKRGLTRQQLIEALAVSDMNNGVLLDAIKEKEEAVLSLSRELTARNNTIQALESRGKEAREKIEALKGMVHDARNEIADLNGYLRRVAEDDHARDGFFPADVTTEIPTKNIPIARRQSMRQTRYDHGPGRVMDEAVNYESVARTANGRPSTWRDKHWSQW